MRRYFITEKMNFNLKLYWSFRYRKILEIEERNGIFNPVRRVHLMRNGVFRNRLYTIRMEGTFSPHRQWLVRRVGLYRRHDYCFEKGHCKAFTFYSTNYLTNSIKLSSSTNQLTNSQSGAMPLQEAQHRVKAFTGIFWMNI